MNSFDNDLRNAARADNEDLMHAGDEGLLSQAMSSFRSRMRYWLFLVWGMTFVMMGLGIWMAISFFNAETTRDMIMYATIFTYAMFAIGMLKMWAWMEMNRNTHTREIKRVEMQIARLAERLEQK